MCPAIGIGISPVFGRGGGQSESEYWAANYPYGMLAVYNGQSEGTSEQRIGMAYTLDGITWSRYSLNPIITKGAGGTFDDYHVAHPRIVIVNDIMYVYYSGYDDTKYGIGLARSTDHGFTWIKYGQVLAVGAGGQWDDAGVLGPSVIYDPDEADPTKKWKMWYSGNDGTLLKVGLAYSPDGLTWTKYASNPVLLPGAGGQWDSRHVSATHIKKVGSTYYFFYAGSDTDGFYISGLCTFTNPEGTYTKSVNNPILSNRILATQDLTANTLTGSPTITVADSSVFELNEYVLINDSNSEAFLARVLAKPNGTTITLDRNVNADYTTAQGAKIRSVYYSGVNVGTLYYTGTRWEVLITVFGVFSGADPEQREYVGHAYCNTIDGVYTLDIDKGLCLVPDPASTWDLTSMENFSAIALPWALGTFDDRTVSLVAQMTALGETPTDARKTNINTTIVALKGNNITSTNFFAKFDRFIVYRATGNGSRMLNWIANAFNAEGVANGGTLSQHDDIGVHGDGTNSYIRSHYIPSSDAVKLTQNNACYGFKISGTKGVNLNGHGGGDATKSLCYVNGTSGSASYPRCNDLGSLGASGSHMYDVGANCVSRALSTANKVYRQTSGETTNTLDSVGLPTVELSSLCFNNNATQTFFTPATEILEFEWQGSAITYTEFQTLITILNNYIAAL